MNLRSVIVGSIFMVIVGGVTALVVLVPAATFNPTPTAGLRPYTPQEQRGLNIYFRENCYVCHSQFVRLQDEGMGPVSEAGDYAYNTTNIFGSSRNGPDLTNIGSWKSEEWEIAHLKNPRAVSPGSYMPSFSYLTNEEMKDLVAYLRSLGSRKAARPWEVKDVNIPDKYRNLKSPFPESPSAAAAGRGIYMSNCQVCHGAEGRADTPTARVFTPKPAANFHLPRYKDFTDGHWFYKIARGVAGTQMPRWDQTLNTEQIWYLAEYLKSLAKDQDLTPKPGREQYYTKEILQPGDVDSGHKVQSGGH